MKSLPGIRFSLSLLTLFLLASGNAFSQNNPLPEFAFRKTDGTLLTPAVLAENKPIVIFYFDPDCEHCNQQAEWIKKKHEYDGSFGGITMIWVSWNTNEKNGEFMKKYFAELNTSMVHFAKDDQYKFDKWFGYSDVPSIFVYGKDRLLKKKFTAETAAEELLKFARM